MNGSAARRRVSGREVEAGQPCVPLTVRTEDEEVVAGGVPGPLPEVSVVFVNGPLSSRVTALPVVWFWNVRTKLPWTFFRRGAIPAELPKEGAAASWR